MPYGRATSSSISSQGQGEQQLSTPTVMGAVCPGRCALYVQCPVPPLFLILDICPVCKLWTPFVDEMHIKSARLFQPAKKKTLLPQMGFTYDH